MTKELQSIIEAYEGILFEGKEAMFKVGDKVGVGNYDSHYTGWYGQDTGTVTKVNAHGHHTVQFDNRKSADDQTKQYTEQFDHRGRSRKEYSRSEIIPIEQHEKNKKESFDRAERANDYTKVGELIAGHRNGFGHYSKLSKEHAELIKSMVDKHTATE